MGRENSGGIKKGGLKLRASVSGGNNGGTSITEVVGAVFGAEQR